jgi:hypothetical protein
MLIIEYISSIPGGRIERDIEQPRMEYWHQYASHHWKAVNAGVKTYHVVALNQASAEQDVGRRPTEMILSAAGQAFLSLSNSRVAIVSS